MRYDSRDMNLFAYLTILVFLFKMSKRLRNRMEERELDEWLNF